MIYASFIIHRCNFPTVVAIKIHSVDQHDPETNPARDLLDRDFQFPCHCSFDTTFSIQRNVDEAPCQRTPWKQTYGTIFGVQLWGAGSNISTSTRLTRASGRESPLVTAITPFLSNHPYIRALCLSS